MPKNTRSEVDVRSHNRAAWDKWVEEGIEWSIPVSDEVIAAAREGDWSILLSETRAVPREWFPALTDRPVLCLASGGGQQGPILAAAGAVVTVFDNSPKQLEQDERVARKHDLPLTTIEGDARDLSVFADESFDLIVNPPSNVFMPEIQPVWNECYRVLKPGGVMMVGIVNPMEFIFHTPALDDSIFEVRYRMPYSDLTSVSEAEREEYFGKDEAYEFSHTFEEQIGGQLQAGFVITGFFEDKRREGIVREYFPSYFVTRAEKRA